MKWYKYLQILSIDVALGACCMAYFISRILEIQTPYVVYFSLAMSVWLIYTIDHLMDSRNIEGVALTVRHRYHQKYFRQLSWIWLVLFLVTGVISILYLPTITIKVGLLAAIMVIVHLVLVYLLGNKISILIQKELGVAITYSVGVVIGPLSLNHGIPVYIWWVVVQIFLYAFINLLEFSYFDNEIDREHGQTSIAQSIGKLTLEKIIKGVVITGAFLNFYCFFSFPNYFIFQLILFFVFSTLALIIYKKENFSNNGYYRLFGDLVFLYPCILLIIE